MPLVLLCYGKIGLQTLLNGFKCEIDFESTHPFRRTRRIPLGRYPIILRLRLQFSVSGSIGGPSIGFVDYQFPALIGVHYL